METHTPVHAYIHRVATVDLGTRTVSTSNIEDATARRYIGGTGLGTKLLFDLTDATSRPLDSATPLIFSTGPLTGTSLLNSDRIGAVSISPLTGIFAESSAGGQWGSTFRKCGYDSLVIIGKASQPVIIAVGNSTIEILAASDLWGKDTIETTDILKQRYGSNAQAATIGIAGENLVNLACIVTGGAHGRTLGRCGLGAVMGSKLLKAVVVNGNGKVPMVDIEKLRSVSKAMAAKIRTDMQGMKSFGTGGGLVDSEALGNLPIRNWGQGSWPEGAAKTTGSELANTLLSGTYHCGSCAISCGRVVTAADGPYAGREIGGPEYETLGLMGTNLMNDDLPTIIKANELCNRYGLDTISTAGAIGFGMEAWEHGLLQKAGYIDDPLPWGDRATIVQTIARIAAQRGVGILLGRGVKEAAEHLGPESIPFAAHVKGLEPPAHDGRAKMTAALGLATSNRGACHLAAFSHDFEQGAVLEDLGTPPLVDRFTTEGKAENVVVMQHLMCMFDAATACKFALFGGLTVDPLIQAINAATGWDMDRSEFFATGERIFNLKRLYNTMRGIRAKDDTLPHRMLHLPRGAGAGHIPPLDQLLAEYYALRGWDADGIPTWETATSLGLEEYRART